MNNIKEIIKRIKGKKGIKTNTSLAEYLGVSYNTFNTWVKRGKFPEEVIKKIVQNEQLSYDWLLNGVESIKSETKIGQSASLSVSLIQGGAGEGVYNFQSQEMLLSLNPKLFPFLTGQPITAVQIDGDSMEPTLRQGDYILITPPNPERQTEDGIYAIRIEGMVKVKSLQFLMDGTIKIISDNTKYSPEIYNPNNSQVDFAILGKQRLIISR